MSLSCINMPTCKRSIDSERKFGRLRVASLHSFMKASLARADSLGTLYEDTF